jgi:phosphoglycolate phosphatase-like HAD superfamily hydrolase
VLSGGAGQRAFTRAFEELFAVADGFRDIPMAGRTDTWILANAAAAHGIPPDQLAQFHDVYLRHLARELEPPNPGKRIMPGVRALLEALSTRTDVYLALLTGNYHRAARVKLEHFDLWRYFPCGAFADDAADRNSLVPMALARVRECGGPVVDARDVVVIGDTPHDVACALAAGARAVGVATGPFTADQLRASGARAVFEDLSDTGAFLDLLEIRPDA